jgi:glutathione S-transferase
MAYPILWHFPVSHFNEKVRWALDYKKIRHARRVLGPGYLMQTWWATGQGRLPVLMLDGEAVADSTRIIARLEQLQPDPALYPAEPSARTQALELEDFFDEGIGPAIRTVIVGELFVRDPDAALLMLTNGMGKGPRRAMKMLSPGFRAFYKFRHDITPATIESGRATVLAALERIERQLQPSGYLIGERFSVADLTAGALLSPLVMPPEFPYPPEVVPELVARYRESLAGRAAFQWALDIYRCHRGVSAEAR